MSGIALARELITWRLAEGRILYLRCVKSLLTMRTGRMS